jgi:hypothetical protein
VANSGEEVAQIQEENCKKNLINGKDLPTDIDIKKESALKPGVAK